MNESQRAAALRLADSLTNSLTNAPRTRDEAASLLRELAAEPVQEPVAWLVTSSSGPVFAAAWKQGAHDHINDMLMRDEIDDLDEVKSWRVVPVYAAPQQRVEPLQKPVAWMHFGKVFDTLEKAQHDEMRHRSGGFKPKPIIPLYAAPQQRKPLSNEDIWSIWEECAKAKSNEGMLVSFARAVEQAHGIGCKP